MIGWARDRALVEVPGTYESRGTTYTDWENPTSWTTRPGSFQPEPTQEDLLRGASERIAGVFLVQDPRPIPGNARLTIRGRVYGVVGEAAAWDSPTGALAHQRVVLETWKAQ